MGSRVNTVRHSLADFIAEFTFSLKEDRDRQIELSKWKLYVDGSSNENGSRAGLMLISPENHRISNALRFTFKASNNEAEYEALLAGLRLTEELLVESFWIFSDSKLVVSQISGEFQVRDDRMAVYLEKVKAELQNYSMYEAKHVEHECFGKACNQ